jgi:2'-5' RNA ligase
MARRIRTFIAADIDRAIRERTVDLQDTLAGSGVPVRWVVPENLHVTLLFLGEVDERELISVCRTVETVCQAHVPFAMRIESTGAFPNNRRPKILWAGVGDGTAELTAIHDDLEPPLMELGCYRREDRPYTPHLTLGRVTGEEAADPLATALAKHSKWRGGVVTVREILVMSSELGRDGPVYSLMSRAKLLGGAAAKDEE